MLNADGLRALLVSTIGSYCASLMPGPAEPGTRCRRACAPLGIRQSAVTAVVTAAVPALVLCLLCAGCGDDGKSLGPSKKTDPFPPLSSPENVLRNLQNSYELGDYDHFAPLIRDDFVFIFYAEDIPVEPGQIPAGGFWGAPEELLAMRSMLDSTSVLSDPRFKVVDIEMEVALAGALRESNQQGAPKGTLEGYVSLDLEVTVREDVVFLVRSRPLFFFAPDSADDPRIWRLWKCQDGPWDEESLSHAQDSFPGLIRREIGPSPGLGESQSSFLKADPDRQSAAVSALGIDRRSPPDIPAIERSTWGAVKALYHEVGSPE